MTDPALYDLERAGHPVTHVRALHEHRRMQVIHNRTREAVALVKRRRVAAIGAVR